MANVFPSDTMVLLGDFLIVIKGAVRTATAHFYLLRVVHLRSVFACMPKKMPYWKRVEKELETTLCSIATRMYFTHIETARPHMPSFLIQMSVSQVYRENYPDRRKDSRL